MKDKNKKELENIVRRDDSGNEIEPSTKGLGKAYHNLDRLFFEKSGLESKGYKPNPTYNYELLKEHREHLMDDFIIEYLAELEANDVNITEDDRRRLEIEWIEKELTVVDKWMEEDEKGSIPRLKITKKVELGKYKKYLEDRLVAIQNPAKPDGEKQSTEKEFTTARQVLALYYLLTYNKATTTSVNKTDFARFTQFLTGKEAGNPNIENTSIYKKWKNLFKKDEKKNIQDLKYIKPFFEKLGLSEVVKMIDNDIDNADA